MELVYLWVEEYKNIRNQGFNFSPRFECEFDGENLTITENKDYMSIFPDKINITAIVGENGSGKSNLLNFISSILLTDEIKYNYFLICVENKNNLVLYKNFNTEIKDINNKIKEPYKIPTDNIIDNYRNLSSLHIDNHEKNYSPIEDIDNAVNIINNTKKYHVLKFINDSTKFFIPTIARINIISKRVTEDEQKKINKLNEKIPNLLKRKKYYECLTNIKSILSIFKETKYKPSTNSSIILNIIENSKIPNNFTYDINIQDIDEEYLNFIKKLSCLDIDFKLLDNDKSFKDLSFGEQYILKQLHAILNSFDTNKIKTITHSSWNQELDKGEDFDENVKIEKYLLFIDEFELGLHPNWQKKTLSYMIDFFKIFNLKIDLFITSHSPFLLSDLPKENVIFLEKGKQVKPFKEDEQTFGANIHTLLSNGFFMSDGLMGEFAKEKIKEILNFLNDKEELKTIQKEQIKPIIESIGEDFLRNKLLDLYYKHKDFEIESKERKKQILDEKIRKLEEERDKLND